MTYYVESCTILVCLRSSMILLVYRVYMGSSMIVWLLRWLLLYLCSYKLDSFVIIFIVYFDYILSIASLSLCLCISSYSSHSKVHGVGGRHCVSVVLICCLPADTPYILGHVVDCGCDTPIESFVVHSLNIGAHRVRLRRKSKLCS